MLFVMTEMGWCRCKMALPEHLPLWRGTPNRGILPITVIGTAFLFLESPVSLSLLQLFPGIGRVKGRHWMVLLRAFIFSDYEAGRRE